MRNLLHDDRAHTRNGGVAARRRFSFAQRSAAFRLAIAAVLVIVVWSAILSLVG